MRKVSAAAVVLALVMMSAAAVGPDAAHQIAAAATCVSSVGPGIPPPASLPGGIPGFHAAWYGQSGYPTLCPGDKATATVAYYNTGSLGWVAGKLGEVAYLGTWGPEPGQDQATPLGGDGAFGSPATGWPRYNRIAQQPAPYVGPGQVAWFQFVVRAPSAPGYYRLYLRPLVEGATWMEDYGVFWLVTVLNADGSPPALPPAGRDWKQSGVFTGALEQVPTSGLMDSDTMRYLRGKGLTLVRIPVLWERVQPQLNAPLSPDQVTQIRTVLDRAAATGEGIIVEIHNHGRYPLGGRPLGRADAGIFADLWGRIAAAFAGNVGLYGYELMNEPLNLPDGADGWAFLSQAATDAIRQQDRSAWVLVPGYNSQSATEWPSANPTLDIHDPADRLLYSAHIYFDKDFSGYYKESYDAAAAYPREGVDRVLPFLDWLSAHNKRGAITEYGIPNDDPRWLDLMDRFLAVLDADPRILATTYCEAGPVFSLYGCGARMSVEPVGGKDAVQMAVLAKYTSRAPGTRPPLHALPPKGPVYYEAPLDGSGSELGPRYVIGDAAASAIRFPPGAIELAVLQPGGNTGASFALPPQDRYVLEMDVTASSASRAKLWYRFRDTADNRHYLLELDTGAGTVQLVYDEDGVPPEPLASKADVAGLGVGRQVTIALVIDRNHFSVYADEQLLADVADTRLAPIASVPGLTVLGEVGAIRITALRLALLP